MNKKYVAIVDDQAFIRHIYSTELKRENFEIIPLSGGKELIEYLKSDEQKPDIILLDAIMPNLDGFDTCKKIRAMGEKIPVIFLTANSDKQTVIKAIQSGGDDFALKNSDSAKLIKKIYKQLDSKE